MQIIQTNRFQKAYKKLHKNQLEDANKAIKAVMADPTIGVQKKGDLSDVFVYKFKMISQLTLLAYSYDGDKIILTFMALGSHENFYRDINKNTWKK